MVQNNENILEEEFDPFFHPSNHLLHNLSGLIILCRKMGGEWAIIQVSIPFHAVQRIEFFSFCLGIEIDISRVRNTCQFVNQPKGSRSFFATGDLKREIYYNQYRYQWN
jgi:hypothetical protein